MGSILKMDTPLFFCIDEKDVLTNMAITIKRFFIHTVVVINWVSTYSCMQR